VSTLAFLILLSLGLGLGAWLLFLWSVKSGQYEDPEGPKYRMLEDEEEGPPCRGSPGHHEVAAGGHEQEGGEKPSDRQGIRLMGR